MTTLTLAQARQAWLHHQGLSGGADPLAVPGGWSRTLGGVCAYLALRARSPGLTRASVDAALSDGRLWVSPGVRGCIWLLPRDDLSLALRVGHAWTHKRTSREMQKIGVEPAELAALGEAIVSQLAAGPLSPDALRRSLPEGSWRTLGEAGKKRGHTTTLPAALRYLEGAGRIRRVQEGGRLDTQRYLWALAEENLLTLSDDAESPEDPAAQARALTRRFLSWSAPATLEELVGWSLLGKRAARKALTEVGAVAVTVEGLGEAWALPEQLDGLAGHVDEAVHLLPTLDNLVASRGTLASLTHPDWHQLQLTGRSWAERPASSLKTPSRRCGGGRLGRGG